MIYELRTLQLKPGRSDAYVEVLAKTFEARSRYSKLGGQWISDVGTLDQVIEIWPYSDMATRADSLRKVAADPDARLSDEALDLMVGHSADILQPISGSADWTTEQSWGALYELRITSYEVDVIGAVAAGFSKHVANRSAVYPVVGIFTATLGTMHKLYQIHPFKDWTHRAQVRAEFYKTGVWPPPHDSVPHPLTEELRFMTPTRLSPLH